MKLVIGFVVLAVLSADIVCGLEWLRKRDVEPALQCLPQSCRDLFTPVMDVIPTFYRIIQNGSLSLDCSQQNLERADQCINLCVPIRVVPLKLRNAFRIFCTNKQDIEKESSCWANRNMFPAIRACADLHSDYGDRYAYAGCAERRVSNLTGCTTTTGAIARELVLEMTCLDVNGC